MATQMRSLGIDRLVVSKLLNHAESGITKTYDRYAADPEKAAAMERWADRLREIISGKKSEKVFLLRPREGTMSAEVEAAIEETASRAKRSFDAKGNLGLRNIIRSYAISNCDYVPKATIAETMLNPKQGHTSSIGRQTLRLRCRHWRSYLPRGRQLRPLLRSSSLQRRR